MIDRAPLDSPVKLNKLGQWVVRGVSYWERWFNSVTDALNRITLTESITFGPTAAGAYTLHQITFPAGSFKVTDTVIMTAPCPQSGTSFSVYITLPDEVTIAFNNYSGALQAFPLPEQFTVTIMRN